MARTGKHPTLGQTPICIWYRLEKCSRPNCTFAHDDSVPISEQERKECLEEIKYRRDNGIWKGSAKAKAKGKAKAKSGAGNQQKPMTRDGKEVCRFWLMNSCNKGADCKWAHHW